MSEVSTDGSIFNGVVADIAEINPRIDIALTEEEQVSFLSMQNTSESGDIISLQSRLLGEVSKGYTRFAENDVLVAKITPCFENGKGGFARGLLNGIGFGSTEFHVVRAMPGKADSKFLHHLTRSERFRRAGERSMTGSAGQKRIPAEFIKELPIFVPPLPEQKKIAEMLSGVDSVIKEELDMASKIAKQYQGILHDVFNHESSCLPQDNYLPVEELGLDISDGNYSSKYPSANEFVERGIPFIRASNVKQGSIDDNDMRFISPEKHQQITKGHLKSLRKNLAIPAKMEQPPNP